VSVQCCPQGVSFPSIAVWLADPVGPPCSVGVWSLSVPYPLLSLSHTPSSLLSPPLPSTHTTAPSRGRPNCTWKELFRQTCWYDTKLPLPRDRWTARYTDKPWMEDLRDCCKGGNWLGVRRLCATHEYTESMFPSNWYHPLAWAASNSVDCLRILLVEFHSDPERRNATGWTLIHCAGQCWYTVSLLLLTRPTSSNLPCLC